MFEIEDAMDRYETAAKRRGFNIRARASSFDEASARMELQRVGVACNAEYFFLLKRWNGAELAGFRKGDDGEGYFGLCWEFPSFSNALKSYEFIKDAAEFEEQYDFFGIFVDVSGDKLGYARTSGDPSLHTTLHDTPGDSLEYRSLATAIDTFAAALDAGLTLRGDLKAYARECVEFAEIAKRFNPGVPYWDGEIAYWTEVEEEES